MARSNDFNSFDKLKNWILSDLGNEKELDFIILRA